MISVLLLCLCGGIAADRGVFGSGPLTYRAKRSVYQVDLSAASNITLSWTEGPNASKLRLEVAARGQTTRSVVGTSPLVVPGHAGWNTVSVIADDLESPILRYTLSSPASGQTYKLTPCPGPVTPTSSNCEGTCPVLNGEPEDGTSITSDKTWNSGALTVQYAIPFKHPNALTLREVLIFTKGDGTQPVTAQLFGCSNCVSGCPGTTSPTAPDLGSPLSQSATITPGTTLDWWTTPLLQPASATLRPQTAACEVFYLVLSTTTADNVHVPQIVGGSSVTAEYRTRTGTGAWTSSLPAVGWAICFKCDETGTGEPQFDVEGLLQINRSIELALDCVRPQASAVLLLQGGTGTFNLGPLGAPTCSSLSPVGAVLSFWGASQAGRAGTGSILIPNGQALIGAKIFAQWVVLNETYANNAGGLTVSNTVSLEIGR